MSYGFIGVQPMIMQLKRNALLCSQCLFTKESLQLLVPI